MTRAFASLGDYREDRPFGPWLRGILLNLCRNYLRDRSRHARPISSDRLAEAPATEGRRHGVLSGILRRETSDLTFEAIGQLPIPLREAFVLHYIEGMDYAEIGQARGPRPRHPPRPRPPRPRPAPRPPRLGRRYLASRMPLGTSQAGRRKCRNSHR